jgi:hypothetical protein
MAFDLYLYRSQLGKPDFNEAVSVTAEDPEADIKEALPEERDRQVTIAQALLEVNPRLQPFELDHSAIAEIQGISIDEARLRFDYLQFNTPEDELATSIEIYRNHVAITVPKSYEGEEADKMLSLVQEYARAIHDTAGYFAFDPQTGRIYDPSPEVAQPAKEPVVIPDMAEYTDSDTDPFMPKKPWWKFW